MTQVSEGTPPALETPPAVPDNGNPAIPEHGQPDTAQERRREFFKTNFAAVLALLTSIASLVITYYSVQVTKSAEKERRQLEARKLDLDRRKADSDDAEKIRKVRLELLDFTTRNSDLIFGTDELKKKKISQIMAATFPLELVLPLFENFEKGSPGSTAWKDGASQARALAKSQGSDRRVVGVGRVIAGLTGKPGTRITLKVRAVSDDVITFAGVLSKFDANGGVVAEKWSADQLTAGVTTTLGDAPGYNFIILPVSKAGTNPTMDVEINAENPPFSEAETVEVGDNIPFGYRIFILR